MTLPMVMNLGFAWGATSAATGQSPTATRYRAGSRVQHIYRVWWLVLAAAALKGQAWFGITF